jgi:hypothetical protein
MTTLDCILEYNFGKHLFSYTYDQTLGLLNLGSSFFVEMQGATPITKHIFNL